MVAGVLAGVPAKGEESDLRELLPVWDYALTVRSSAGYNDNVLLSHEPFQRSGFLQAGIEVIAWRLPIDGPEIQFIGAASHLQYLPNDFADDEQTVLGQAEVKKDFAKDWQASVVAEYLYQSTFVDATSVDANQPIPVLNATKIEGPGYQLTSGLRRYLGDTMWVQASVAASRWFYGGDIGDYWEIGPRATAGGSYGHVSEWSVSYHYDRRDYDDRQGRFLDGSEITGSRLAFYQHYVDASVRHYWDAARRWLTATGFSWRRNEDNSSGYYNYDRLQVSEKIRYRARSWEVAVGARLAWYDYQVQRIQDVFGNFTEPRERTEMAAQASIEKRFAKWLKGFVEFEREQTLANADAEEYAVNKVTGGLSWEF